MKRFLGIALLSVSLSTNLYALDKPEMLAVVEQSAGTFSLYDSTTGKQYGSVKVGDLPHEVIISKDKKTAYISNFGIQDYDETIGKPGVSISVVDMQNFLEKERLYLFDSEKDNNLSQVDGAPHGMRLRPPFEKELFVNVEKGKKMYVFNVDTHKVIRKFPLADSAHNLIFSPDGKALWVIAGKKGAINMDPDSGKEIGRFKLSSPIRGLKYTPDNRYIIASANNEIALFDPLTLKLYKRYANLGVGQIIYSDITPDGKFIIAPAVWDGQAIIIDTESGEVVKRIVTGIDPVTVRVSSNGKFAYVTNARDNHVTEINLKTFDYRYIDTKEGPNGLEITDFIVPKLRSKLNIGVPLPLTGKHAAKGREIMLGYEFWNLFNRKSGGLLIQDKPYDVNFIYLDTQSDPDNIVKLTQDLIRKHKVNILFPTYGESENLLANKTAIKNSMAFFSGTIGKENIKAVSDNYFITINEFKKQFEEYYNLSATDLSTSSAYDALFFQKLLSKKTDDKTPSLGERLRAISG